MPIQFNCIQCNKTIETPDDTAGKKCRCPDCGQIMPIPVGQDSFGQPVAEPLAYTPKPSADPSNPYAAPASQAFLPQAPMHVQYEPADRSPIVLIMGIASIVVSFMSCGCCLLFIPFGLGLGIPAWVMGRNDLRMIAQGKRNPNQKGLLQAGMICGIIGTVFVVFSLIANIAMIFLRFSTMDFNGFEP
jgi:hypothetical protein